MKGFNMESLIIQVVGTVLYMGLEYWLGKTDKVKAGSVIEVVELAAKKLLQKKDKPNA
jgi:hypothetical protein